MPDCELRKANGHADVPCDETECTYWRVVEHIDVPADERAGCAIQYFDLLGDGGSGIAEWLLSVKERVEAEGDSSVTRTGTDG